MKKLFYVSYVFYLSGCRVGHGDIRLESETTGDHIEMSWETMESFKSVIKEAVKNNIGYDPESVFITFMQPLEEHNPDVNLTVNVSYVDKED